MNKETERLDITPLEVHNSSKLTNMVKFKAAITTKEAADDVEFMQALGVEKYLDDESIEFVNIWVNRDRIVMIESGVRGFYNVYLTDGFKFCTKDWDV